MRRDESTWQPFRCDAQPWQDALWIQPKGEIDYATADVVRDTVAHFLEAGFAQLVMDLRKVTFVDSSGLRVLIEARQAAMKREIDFSVAPGPPAFSRSSTGPALPSSFHDRALIMGGRAQPDAGLPMHEGPGMVAGPPVRSTADRQPRSL
jgi:anti-anti-sigma factor